MKKTGSSNKRVINNVVPVSEDVSFVDTLTNVLGSIGRTTIRFFKNIPNKIRDYIKRKINEYKRKPARKDINKVYVLVGYTSKKHIDDKFNAERNLIILRRGLLVLIFVLILFISINSVLPKLKVGKYGDIFGIDSFKELTENDPFSAKTYEVDY